jgi:hypothetical protein
MKVAPKDSENPFFKSRYANLQAVVESARPALCKHGLSVVQYVDQIDGSDYLCTMLGHKSGQFIISRMKISPVKPDPQSLGSCITYLRRYAYAAIVGVYDGIEDDDGDKASHEHEPIKVKVTPRPNDVVYQTVLSDDVITEKQMKYISYQIGTDKELREEILKMYKISNLESIKKVDAQEIIEFIIAKKALKQGV